ncbi:MAG TPA: hypothetical protein VKB49_02015 [Candidatus Sulfotelmatobacter sp.]|nr:hypothetical protein [Candidatus Sulfotelmatobacter sp.]
MLKILRSTKNASVIFTVIGHVDEENLAELKRVIGLEGRNHNLVLDLKDVTQIDQLAIRFLTRCEAEDVTLDNCPAYVREWIVAEKHRNRSRRP